MIKCRVPIGLMVNSYQPAFGMPGPARYAATRSRGINKKVYRLHDCVRNKAEPAFKSTDRRLATFWHRSGFQICPCALADVTASTNAGYLAFTLEVIDAITSEALLNAAARFSK